MSGTPATEAGRRLQGRFFNDETVLADILAIEADAHDAGFTAGTEYYDVDMLARNLHKWGRAEGCNGRNVTQEVCDGCERFVRQRLLGDA